MARGHQQPTNPTRTHAVYSAGTSDLATKADFEALYNAGLCGPLDDQNGYVPTLDEKRHAVELVNDHATVDAYLYHENDASDAVTYGTKIPAANAKAIVCTDTTPCYVFAASGTV